MEINSQSQPVRPPLTRRNMIIGMAGVAGFAAFGSPLRSLLPNQELQPTPRQTAGPFYPETPPADHDNDLVKVTGQDALALGMVLHLRGRLLDRRGTPIQNGRVEIWQCDGNGIYHHPRDAKQGRDAGFQGFGVAQTDARGFYSFRTIRPVPYAGRTPHIHAKIIADGFRALTTQMYDAARAERNARDGIYNAMRADQREAVTVAFTDAGSIEEGALRAVFDIVLV